MSAAAIPRTSLDTASGVSSVDPAVFRHAVGHFASGVTVIATADGEELFGTTASAVSSLSMEPPMMLVCLNRSSRTHDAVMDTGRYAVNILSDAQGELARHFARKGADKFTGMDHELSVHRLPVLGDALATIECAVVDTAIGGTHTVFIGRVLEASAREGEPLAYYRGTFGRLQGLQEASAYDGTREWVLTRRTSAGEPIDVEAVADALRTAPAFVNNALIRLAAESLVTRGEDGAFTPTPMTLRLIDNFYTARLIIETGVVESHLTQFSDELVARIEALGGQLRATTVETEAELRELLERSVEFHTLIVGGAGSAQLTANYRELQIQAVWRDAQGTGELWRAGREQIAAITSAIVARDVTAAKQAIRIGAEHARNAAKSVIASHGGAL